LSPLFVRLLIAAGGHGRIVPRLDDHVAIDWPVILFTASIALLTALLFGLAPAWRSARTNVVGATKQTGFDTAQGGSDRLRSILVVSELALSVMLLIGAGLLIKSLWQLQHVDPGFDAQNVLGLRVSVPESQYGTGRGRALVYQRIVDRLKAVPGVTNVGATNDLPFSGSRTTTSFDIIGRPTPSGQVRTADRRGITADYFATLRIRLLAGRPLTEQDNRRETPRVGVINEALRKRNWPDESPLGKQIVVDGQTVEIVGIVGNVEHDDLAGERPGELYLPQFQSGAPPWTFLAVRKSPQTSLVALIPAVRKAMSEALPGEPVYDVRTMESRVATSVAPQQWSATILATFALFALVLAAVGIYGVIAYAVEQRSHELGVRLALGAQQNDLLRLVVGEGLKLGALGITAGVIGALILGRILAGMLYNTAIADPLTYIAVSAIFAAVCLGSSYGPARRATRLDPLVILRCE
ncbi:MAG: ABC transporter permease, partial [Rhodospirillales bacterium]|nr:ABC transporter permease [Acetobacter sp.]